MLNPGRVTENGNGMSSTRRQQSKIFTVTGDTHSSGGASAGSKYFNVSAIFELGTQSD